MRSSHILQGVQNANRPTYTNVTGRRPQRTFGQLCDPRVYVAALILVIAWQLPVHATPTLVTSEQFAHCRDNPRDIDNLTAQDPASPLSAVPPSLERWGAGGCGALTGIHGNVALAGGQIGGWYVYWEGTHVGMLDNLRVRAYATQTPGGGIPGLPPGRRIDQPQVSIDGSPVPLDTGWSTPPAGTPAHPATGLWDFSVVDIGLTDPDSDNGPHTVRVGFRLSGDAHETLWMWDAQDAASSVTFNAQTPAPAYFRRVPPA